MYFSRKTVLALNCYKKIGKITGLSSVALLIAGVWAKSSGLAAPENILVDTTSSFSCRAHTLATVMVHQQKVPSFPCKKSFAFHIAIPSCIILWSPAIFSPVFWDFLGSSCWDVPPTPGGSRGREDRRA